MSAIVPALEPAERVAAIALAEVEGIQALLRARFRSLSAEDCDDVIQDAIRGLLGGAADVAARYPDAQLRQLVWQRSIDRAKNAVTAQQRRGRQVELLPELVSGRAGPDAEVGQREELALALAFVASLDERSRTWLRLHRIEGLKPRDVRAATGWSEDQFAYAKKRAVAGLRELARKHGSGEWCDEHELLFDGYLLGLADPEDVARVDRHIAHCLACRRELGRRRRTHRRVAGLLPPVAGGGVLMKLGALWAAGRALVAGGGRVAPVTGGAGGGAVTGGSLLTLGAAKAGLVAICVSGAAVACSTAGLLSSSHASPATTHHVRAARHHAHGRAAAADPVDARPPIARADVASARPTGATIAGASGRRRARRVASSAERAARAEFGRRRAARGAGEFSAAPAARAAAAQPAAGTPPAPVRRAQHAAAGEFGFE